MNSFASYLPFAHALRPRPYVGADYDMAAIEQRYNWMVEAVEKADEQFDKAIGEHTGYSSAAAFNTAAKEHAQKLLDLTAAAFPLSTGAEHLTIQVYHGQAADALSHLDAARKALFAAANPKPPIFVFPPNYFAPPPVFVPTLPEDPLLPHVDPSKPPPEPPPPPGSEPPPSPGSEYVLPLLLVLGAVAAYALAPALLARLLSKKGY